MKSLLWKDFRLFGDVLLGGTPAWLLQAVLPVGFGLIAYRYLLFAVKELLQLLGVRSSS